MGISPQFKSLMLDGRRLGAWGSQPEMLRRTGAGDRRAGPITGFAHGFGADFPDLGCQQLCFAALHSRECCYANKCIVSGIWYT
jgi:hypothetical protein